MSEAMYSKHHCLFQNVRVRFYKNFQSDLRISMTMFCLQYSSLSSLTFLQYPSQSAGVNQLRIMTCGSTSVSLQQTYHPLCCAV
ncbi:hypothetical protein C0J52_18900 [Blattella germanica]|nr:hypothetical protein C0J52_18900 [Blattella germanica]